MFPGSKTLVLLCWILLSAASCNDPYQKEFEIQKTVHAPNGMVVSASAIASETGRQILRRGGNAIDAAVAVHFALAVVFPEAGNIGGGGFMVIRLHDGSSYTLDFRETAPGKSNETMYQDEDGNVIRNSNLFGHLASGVPGSVDGMVKAHERFGKLDWKELLEPAISLASMGFSLTERQAKILNSNQVNFLLVNTRSPDFLLKSQWNAGDILKQRDLAVTLALIRDRKRSGFYQGITADNIINEMTRGKGLISRVDLDNYSSVWREPVTGYYKNHKIISMGPPSAGGIALIQMLKMAEHFNTDSISWHDHRYIHLLCEIEKRSYADRAEYLGD
ncbi:MAG TPA: gamma-glutamyltransferase, partial [Cyclobacteriaceae bacterium]|nr:gamma-glutamyltransferase [Cyclobacteriaceae bacterium]